MTKALFLDRDGVINHDYGYVHETRQFVFIEGIFDCCRCAQKNGYLIVVVTNQSGIARGFFSESDFEHLTRHMIACFSEEGVKIADVLYCPTLGGPDRKPEPGLFLKARDKYDIDMARSVNVGDHDRDLEAGLRAGVGKNILFAGDFAPVIRELV